MRRIILGNGFQQTQMSQSFELQFAGFQESEKEAFVFLHELCRVWHFVMAAWTEQGRCHVIVLG